MENLPIAVDAMGGDNSPDVVVRGAIAASRSGVEVVLVGPVERLRPLVPKGSRVKLHHASETVGMAERPTTIRRRPDSTITRMLELVGDGRAAAAVSCGNTGAVLVGATIGLGVLPGTERPALATLLPRQDGGKVVLLDSGANVDCRPELLVSFAQLGVAYARSIGVEQPRVGLLSNGEESEKGNMLVRATLPLLQSLDLEVVGNIEPAAAMQGGCDVLVCDGFVGNVLLKAVEAAASTVVHFLRDEVMARPAGRAGAWLLQRASRGVAERVQWDAHGGALLLGTKGVVVVGHGGATERAVEGAILMADRAVKRDLLNRMTRILTP